MSKTRQRLDLSRRSLVRIITALLVSIASIYLYHHWVDGSLTSHPSCALPLLESECAWELQLALPLALTYWLYVLWSASEPTIISWLLPHRHGTEIPYHPTQRTYMVRLVKAVSVFYLLFYPSAQQVFHLVLSRDASLSYPARFSAFLLRQITLMAALFSLVFSWIRRQRDSAAVQLYWLALTLLFLLQATLTPWHARNTAFALIFYGGGVAHLALVICIIFASRLEQWEEEAELVWFSGSPELRIGSLPDSHIRLPNFCAEGQRTPQLAAIVRLNNGRPLLQVRTSGALALNGRMTEEGEEMHLESDTEEQMPSLVTIGTYYLFAVRRRGVYALRLRHLLPNAPPLIEVDEHSRPYHIALRGVLPLDSSEVQATERDMSVLQVLRLLGQQLPDARAWAALCLALIAGMGYSWSEMEALNSQGAILGGAPAAGSQEDATWNVTLELFYFTLWSMVMYSCQVLNKLASGTLRVTLGLSIRKSLLPILYHRGEERAAYAIGQQCPTLDERLDNWFKNGVISVCQLFFGFGFLTRISLPLTGVVLGASCVYALIIVAKLLLIAWISDRREIANSRLVAEALTALKRARAGQRAAADVDFVDNVNELHPEYMRIVSWESILEVIDLFSYTLVLVAALWFGAVLTQDPEHGLSAEEYVAYSLIAQTFAASLSETCAATTQFTTSYATVIEVARLLAEAESSTQILIRPATATPTNEAFANMLSTPRHASRELPMQSYEALLAEIGRNFDKNSPPPSLEVANRLVRVITENIDIT